MKFYGTLGYIYDMEVERGVWSSQAEEREAFGDVLTNVRRWDTSGEVLQNLTTSNRISVLADRFLCEHMGAMRYVKWNGTTWEIKSVELVRPRAILTLGGVYQGQTKQTSEPDEPTNPDNTQGGGDNGDQQI